MGDDHKPLSPDEYVYRRVSAFEVDEKALMPIAPAKFEPNEADKKTDDGISMFRATHKTPEQLVANAMGKYGYYVVRYQVKELIEIGLTPTLTGKPEDGHISIPELKYSRVKADPDKAESLMTSLAVKAWPRVVLKWRKQS